MKRHQSKLLPFKSGDNAFVSSEEETERPTIEFDFNLKSSLKINKKKKGILPNESSRWTVVFKDDLEEKTFD